MAVITTAFKKNVSEKLLQKRDHFEGSTMDFVKAWGIKGSQLLSLQKGNTRLVFTNQQWLTLGRELQVEVSRRRWRLARTDVFDLIEEDVLFCQKHSKSRMFVDQCAIGKSYSAKYLSRTLRNCFYVDASQAKNRALFIRLLAKALGISDKGRYCDVMANVKYYLNSLKHPPIVIVDEAGDLTYKAFLELKELWNATENNCGWYMMGADGLRKKIQRGINAQKVGYAELFSRFSERYSSIVPTDRREKLAFYKKLIGDVLSVNVEDKSQIPTIIKKCLINGDNIGGLRRAESLLILNSGGE